MNGKNYGRLPSELRTVLDELSGEALSMHLANAFDRAETQARAKALDLGLKEIDVVAANQAEFDKAIRLDRQQLLRRMRRTGGPCRLLAILGVL